MGDTTKIEWADHTASPWYGCSHAVLPDGSEHEGCANCYAEALAKRNPAILGVWGTEGTRVISKSFYKNCETWNKQAERDGVRRSVFPSLCDPFESVEAWDGPLNSWRAGLFSVIDNCPWLDFLLLTKRPQNVRKMWPNMLAARPMFPGMPGKLGQPMPCIVTQPHRKNVWLLASVSNQRTSDKLIPELMECRDLVPVLGLSMEPLLGPVDLRGAAIDWVIVGGESGPNARQCRPEWIRSIVSMCKSAGISCFVKQMGGNVVTRNDMIEDLFDDDHRGWPDPQIEYDIYGFREQYQGADCRIRLNDKKGGNAAEWPEDLRVAEFPKAGAP